MALADAMAATASTSPATSASSAQAIDPSLPGADWIVAGLGELQRGEIGVGALLVAIGAPRLRELGIAVPAAADAIVEPEHQLYALAGAARGDGAHAAYNAWLQRLDRFMRAAVRFGGSAGV